MPVSADTGWKAILAEYIDGRPGQSLADLAARSAPGDRMPGEDLVARQEALLDEAIEETFPASDPIAPKRITK